MKKYLPLITCLISAFSFSAQSQDAASLYESARTFMRQNDYSNAVLVLNRALLLEPENLSMNKDLALCYYFQNDNTSALKIAKPLMEREDADDQVFQIVGSILKQDNSLKESEKVYRKGLKKFPKSGPLYNELGELLWGQQDYDAIKYWETGIEKDPSYSKNYYNAASYYYLTTEKIWSLLYGEIFVNMEPLSSRAPEIKAMLVESYKKLFSAGDLEVNIKPANNFEKAWLKSMNIHSVVLNSGITVESLAMLRTRFILSWTQDHNRKYPFKLFEYQRQLLQDGLFDAYNQWLFGASQNLAAFQNWTNTHGEEYTALLNFQKTRLFKMPVSQYYR